jgi:hypothetical protein
MGQPGTAAKYPSSWGRYGLYLAFHFGYLAGGGGVTLLPYSAPKDRLARGRSARRSAATDVGLGRYRVQLSSLTCQIDQRRLAGGSTKEDGIS